MDEFIVTVEKLEDIDTTQRLKQGGPIESFVEHITASIRAQGVLHPITVTEQPGKKKKFLLRSGLHRCIASKRAGKDTIPVHSLGIVESSISRVTTVLSEVDEDIRRKPTLAIDIAEKIRAMKSAGMARTDIDAYFGLSKSATNNIERLLELPREVREMLRNGRLSSAKARSILALRNSGLSGDELRKAMLKYAQEGSKNGETCQEFQNRIQTFILERDGGDAENDHLQQNLAAVAKLGRQVGSVIKLAKSLLKTEDTRALVRKVLVEHDEQLTKLLSQVDVGDHVAEKTDLAGVAVESDQEPLLGEDADTIA